MSRIFPILVVITDTFDASKQTANNEQELKNIIGEEAAFFLNSTQRNQVRDLVQRSMNFFHSRQNPSLLGFHEEVNGTSFSLYCMAEPIGPTNH